MKKKSKKERVISNPHARVLQLEAALQKLRMEVCAMPGSASVRVSHLQDLITSVCFDNDVPDTAALQLIPEEQSDPARISA